MALQKILEVAGVRNETPDCKTFVLKGEEKFEYQAGQFLTFVFPKFSGEARRSYSFSSSPALNEPPAITIRRVVNGEYSRRILDNVGVGHQFSVIGPNGFFTLPENIGSYRQFIFMAAGSGITPVYSLIKTILHQHHSIEVVLIYSNRNRSQVIFLQELHELMQNFPERLKIEWLFSNNPDLTRARLSKWLVGILLKKYRSATDEETLFYLCGPCEYMRMIQIELREENFPVANVRKELFESLPIPVKVQPPDREMHKVELRTGQKTFHIDVQYPETILSAAKAAGIEMPYSCEAGRCGTCAAICIKGKVWMRYNEVLLDEEIEKGRILTCTGTPVGGDAIISI